MSTKFKFLLIFIITSFCANAQVKIGENPNTINSASIVELESTNKAFVLTRLTTAQMQAITPLNGAVVYNTDTQCVHYYNGLVWTNLCDGNSSSFSFTDNGDGTITLSNGEGNNVTFDGAPQTISTLADNGDGTYTYTNENGLETIIAIAETDNQNLQTDSTPGNISIDNGNAIAINVDDADADAQNEIQTLDYTSGVLTLSNDPNATTVDLSGFDQNAADDFSGSFNDLTDLPLNLDTDATDDFNTGISFDGTNLIVTDAGGDVSTDISGLAYDDTAIRADIDQNELDADNAIATVDTKIDDHILADEDTSSTNELSDISITGTTVTLTNAAAGATGVDLGNTFATDAEVATAISDSEALDLDKVIGNESVTALTFDGTTLTLDQDGAASETVDLSGVSTDDQKIDTFSLTGTTIAVSNEGDGEANKTIDLGTTFATDNELADAITASEALDLDKVIGNESVTALTFDGTTLTLDQDGAASETVDLSSVSTDDQKIDTFSLTGTTIAVSNEGDGEADKTIDLGNTFATDAEVATAISDSEALDLDKLIGNESVTALTFDGTTLTLDQDGAASETVDLSGVSTDDQKIDTFSLTGTTIAVSNEGDGEADKTIDLGTTFATDTELADAITASEALDLDKVIGNESVTALTFDGTTLTLDQDGAASETVDLSGVSTDDQKIDTFSLTGTTIAVSNEGDGEADKTIDLGNTFATDTEVATAISDSEALDLDKVIGNESVTGLTFDGTTLTLDQDGAASETVDLSGVSTDDQKIDTFSLTGTTIAVSNEGDGEADKTIDLGNTFATDTEVATAISDSEALDLDKDANNETNTAFASATNTLTITDSNGALTAPIVNSNELDITTGEITSTINGVASTPISLPVADGSETVINDGTNTTIAGAGTAASPYTIAVPDNLDNSVTNETNTAFASATNTLTITDSNGALDAPIVNTNELDITAGEITSTINGVASTPITLPVADGSETVINDGTNTTIAGAGTAASPYIIAVPDNLDNSVTNETNTAFASATNTLTITDSNGALDAPIVNSNELDITAGEITSTINGVTSTPITLPVADGSETLVTAGSDISVSGTGVTGDPYVVANTFTEIDDSVTNETNTAFASATNTLTITDSNGALDAPIVNTNELAISGGEITSTINGVTSTPISLPVADGSETVINDGTNTTIAGAGTAASPYTIAVPDNLDNSVTNETNTAFASATNTLTITDNNGALDAPIVNSNELAISGGEITSTINGVASTPITLPVADGSETIINDGTNTTIAGAGTAASPYTIAVPDNLDNSVTNELSDLSLSATNILTLTNPLTGSNQVDLSSISTDDQTVEMFAFNGSTFELLLKIEDDPTTQVANLSSLYADGTETEITAGTGISITGDGSSTLPYNIINDFTEVDGSITNETNTSFATVDVAGVDYLRISDSNGDLDVPLSDLSHTGTTGSVFFAGADGRPTENNSQLFWDATNNRLSIGNPLLGTNKLTVNGTTRTSGLNNSDGSTTLPSYRFSDDSDTGIYSPAADEIGLVVGEIEALKVEETSGNTSVIINETLELEGAVLDENDSPGTAGQVLTSTATGTEWVNSMSPIKAIGKISSAGTVTKATAGVTVTRISVGYYRVTLPAGSVSDADYIIQLTQPGRGGAGNDDPGISYSNQTATSFEVIIGDNDNGGTDRSRFDSEFMFTVLDL
ncbi:beta strand repeat-containing protein [Maribacter forsetii]|uniref:beta strand repeat-containing protein n=1 Tax=Maribacter forsetii TaxID=444515 RepID=UPI000568EE59|nr:hypothetical protein [Maribacter forsetii]